LNSWLVREVMAKGVGLMEQAVKIIAIAQAVAAIHKTCIT